MKNFCAEIQWTSCSMDGRKTLPQLGVLYYPHISINREIDNRSWSVCFPITPINYDGSSTICFSMLVDNKDTRQFSSKLCVGMNFTLSEGNTIVATGKIKQILTV